MGRDPCCMFAGLVNSFAAATGDHKGCPHDTTSSADLRTLS
jgi:hypothetical protein